MNNLIRTTNCRNDDKRYHFATFSLLAIIIVAILISLLFINVGSSYIDKNYNVNGLDLVTSLVMSGDRYFTGNAYAQSDEPVLRYSDSGIPVIQVPGLTTEIVAEGLQLPTTMAFLGPADILVLEKDKGTVKRITDGQVQVEPLLDVNVANAVEECMCGIAISRNNLAADGSVNKTYVFIYYTESDADGGNPIGNRMYRYEFLDGQLVNPKLLLDLPGLPGPRHNGGAIKIGPDNNVYAPVGDVDKVDSTTEAQNNPENPADGSSGILRITQDGEPVKNPTTGSYVLGDTFPLNLYYAYGIRNSFGIDFDPVTGNLWDTENGAGYGDEINLVEPGFNSGWGQVMGIWERGGGDPREGESTIASEQPQTLVELSGIGRYQPPKLAWLYTIGLTAIEFLDSDKYGNGFKNDMFVGDIHNGNIYHFKLNEGRTELILTDPLADKVADTDDEAFSTEIVFGTGFGGISDIEVSPFDGYMYVVSLGLGKIFKIVPGEQVVSTSTDEGIPDQNDNEATEGDQDNTITGDGDDGNGGGGGSSNDSDGSDDNDGN
jgi:aldose sugar dehydrogenase